MKTGVTMKFGCQTSLAVTGNFLVVFIHWPECAVWKIFQYWLLKVEKELVMKVQ